MSTKYATQSTATREPFNPITPPGSSTRGSAHRAMSHRPSRVESPDFLVVTTSPEDPEPPATSRRYVHICAAPGAAMTSSDRLRICTPRGADVLATQERGRRLRRCCRRGRG
jgi:hypothetical protein